MERKKLIKINLVDSDYGCSSVGFVFIKKGDYEMDMNRIYNIFDSLWNGGESYENYEEYLEHNDKDDYVRDNFEKLVEATLSYGWEIQSLVEVINVMCPEAEAEYIKEDYEFTFCW